MTSEAGGRPSCAAVLLLARSAPTTSLPEDLGGSRNWDYRYCWLRDSVLTLNALLLGGYTDEALAFRDFAFRAGTGDPAKLQIMYGVGGERRLDEFELDWLPGYEGSSPVRVGNAAVRAVPARRLRRARGRRPVAADKLDRLDPERLAPLRGPSSSYVETVWREPDDGIWEGAGPRRHYTQSKVMAWVVFDRRSGSPNASRGRAGRPVGQVRQEIHDEVCEKGYDAQRGTFTQYYGSTELDAATLAVALVGFLPGADSRSREHRRRPRELGHDGFISRYSTADTDDGLPGTEGQFLACSFWLARRSR